jgi:hypothetical protein
VKTLALIVVILVTVTTAPARADSAVADIRDLYVNAEYERALALAATADTSGLPPSARVEIAGYQAACLIALGRTAEAEAMMAVVVRSAPQQSVPIAASPKMSALFAAVRARILPDLVRERYADAKALLEAKHYQEARAAFHDVQALVTAAESVADAGPLADVRLLATEFEAVAKERAAAAPTAAAVVPAVSAAAPVALRVYDRTDTTVVAPVTVLQRISLGEQAARVAAQHRRASPLPLTADLVVTIDANGQVERAVVAGAVSPALDEDLVASALRWKYRPARRDGSPVRYAKIVRVEIK